MWTKYALDSKFVEQRGNSFFFDQVPNGRYVATGHEHHTNKPIRREYVVNDRIDRQSKWAMWNDFCGRSGLTNIWFVDDDNRRRLIWRG